MRQLWVVVMLMSLCSCSYFDNDVQRGYQEDAAWHSDTTGEGPWSSGKIYDTSATFTTAGVRIITQRTHPLMRNPIICVEPVPDVAYALSTSGSLTAKGGTTNVSGNLTVSAASSEAVDELAGRSTALLGLRDGLFEACEAYANGIIGQDAYALVLSHYGQLMTTLFLGQDITSANAAQAKPAVSSPPLSSQVNSTPGSDGGQATPPKAGAMAATAPSATTPPVMYASAATPPKPRLMSAGAAVAAELIPVAGAAAGAPVAPAPVVKPPTPAPKPTPQADSGTPAATNPPSSGSTADGAVTAALALTRMNEDYMHQGLLGTLLVACINEYDPTRYEVFQGTTPSVTLGGQSTAATYTLPQNQWLVKLCISLEDPRSPDSIDKVYAADRKADWPPVDPTQSGGKGGSGGTASGHAAGKTPDPTVKAVQAALAAQGCLGCRPGAIDGIDGPSTDDAISAYEVQHNIPPDGNYTNARFQEAIGLSHA